MNINRIFLKTTLAASLMGAPLMGVFSVAAHADTVYKHTDETGRISYSNTPRKGAVIVDLAPLTLMQGVPLSAQTPIPAKPISAASRQPQNLADTNAGSASSAGNTATATSAQPSNLQNSSNAMSPKDAPLMGAVDKTADTNLPSNTTSGAALPPVTPVARISSVPVSIANAAVAGGQSAASMAGQRRENVRRRVLEGEIEAEHQLLLEARQTLAAEQARSPAMRALRVALPNESKPSETTIESRALIERHFARVRDLQDQLTMHDDNIAQLRGMLAEVATSSLGARAPSVTKTPAKTPPNLAIVSATRTPSSVAIKAGAKDSAKEAKALNQPVTRAGSTLVKPLITGTQADGTAADDTTNLRAVSQLPVVKLRPASHTNQGVAPSVNANAANAANVASAINATNVPAILVSANNTNASATANTNVSSTVVAASVAKRNMAEDR